MISPPTRNRTVSTGHYWVFIYPAVSRRQKNEEHFGRRENAYFIFFAITLQWISRNNHTFYTNLQKRKIIFKMFSASSNVDADDLYAEREIVVSASINLPFSADVAFSAFADLPRQPSWSPWLYSVSFIEEESSETTYTECGIPLLETEWVMRWKKAFRFSWKSQVRKFERPNMIQWESTSGLKNIGRVVFTEHESKESDGQDLNTDMLLEMKFVAPRVVASLMKRSDKISNFMENKMLNPTLANFRTIVMEEDLGISPMKEGRDD